MLSLRVVVGRDFSSKLTQNSFEVRIMGYGDGTGKYDGNLIPINMQNIRSILATALLIQSTSP